MPEDTFSPDSQKPASKANMTHTAGLDLSETVLLTAAEAARLLNVSPATVHRLIASGELPSFKIGALRRIHRDVALEWAASMTERQAVGTIARNEVA